MPKLPPRFVLGVLVSFLVLLTACTPAAGRPAEEFVATPADIIGEIAAFGVTLQPGDQMHFFSIETIGDRFITLSSESTTGYSILFGRVTTRLTFSATERGGVTLLAASGRGNNAEAMLDRVINHLYTVFEPPAAL